MTNGLPVSRRLWGVGNTSPLKTTAWEAIKTLVERGFKDIFQQFSRTRSCYGNVSEVTPLLSSKQRVNY